MKREAVAEYRSAIEKLESLIIEDDQTKYLKAMYEACSQLNSLDSKTENATRAKKWKKEFEKRQKN